MTSEFREPVLTWAVLPSGLTVLFAALQVFGVLPGLGESEVQTVVQAILFVIMVVGWVIARSKVTPLADPRDVDGAVLVREDLTRG